MNSLTSKGYKLASVEDMTQARLRCIQENLDGWVDDSREAVSNSIHAQVAQVEAESHLVAYIDARL
jgi:hypothetical protein